MNNINMLTVYLGSSGHARPVFKDSARALGAMIAREGKHLVYGGMDAGLMGLLAKSALDHGGRVTGIIPRKIKDSERILPDLSETILVEELCDRKKRMFLMADAVLALPGGFGTLDESLEILYWGGLKMHRKPLVLINIEGYWDDLIPYLQGLEDFDPRYLIVAQTLNELFPALQSWSAPDIPHATHDHYPHFEDEIMRNTSEPIVIDKASVENTYFAICAMGLKQLGKHGRGIGLLNTGGQFDGLIAWLKRAAQERFITEKCLQLFTVDTDEARLRETLRAQKPVHIDLHGEKWGESEAV
ncbi:MAG: TIGR00730 family Rossman fold protein [Alphaproteobacteria bacterium]|nr:TIGR00730 family Rossman fold protein [Alphaproteobacteria bacterium]